MLCRAMALCTATAEMPVPARVWWSQHDLDSQHCCRQRHCPAGMVLLAQLVVSSSMHIWSAGPEILPPAMHLQMGLPADLVAPTAPCLSSTRRAGAPLTSLAHHMAWPALMAHMACWAQDPPLLYGAAAGHQLTGALAACLASCRWVAGLWRARTTASTLARRTRRRPPRQQGG